MSQNKSGQEAHNIDLDNPSLHIGIIRARAKELGIASQRDWKRTDFVKAIRIAQGQLVDDGEYENEIPEIDDTVNLVADYSLPSSVIKQMTDKKPLKPGYARIVIHKDPTPGHANSSVPLGLNGTFMLVPRGVEVDVPLEFISVLQDAVQTTITQKSEPTPSNPAGEIVEQDILSYPFQVLAVRPGPKFKSAIDQRSIKAAKKEEFAQLYGKYPTDGELFEWEKEKRQAKQLQRS